MKTKLIFGIFLYSSTLLGADQLQFIHPKIILNQSSANYSIDAEFPQIEKPANVSETQFNRAAKAEVIHKIEEFKKTLAEFAKTTDLPASIKANGSKLVIRYNLSTIEPKQLVSVRYFVDQFHAGAPHPNHEYSALNYDLIHNTRLSLGDLFRDSQYLSKISTLVENQIMQRLKAEGQESSANPEGFKPIPENYSIWNFTQNGLQFTLNEEQVVPYAFGPQTAVVSYSTLKPIFAPNTIIAKCLTQNPCTIRKIR